MTQQEALARLAEILMADYKHPNYENNCKLYLQYLALSTGQGIEKYLQQFSSREDEDAFKERKKVTVDICKSIVKNLCHVFYRVTRSSGIKIDKTVVDKGKEEAFTDISKSFGRYGISGWMEMRCTDLQKIDPNSWLVIDMVGTDGKDYARPYPLEFYSPDVIDYKYLLNELIYLVVKQDKVLAERVLSDYTIYTDEGAVKLVARPEIKWAPAYTGKVYKTGELIGFNEHQEKNQQGQDETVADVYEVFIPTAYMLEYVPAFNIGYLTDEKTRGETFVNIFDNAVPFFEKLIKINSESDISACKHAFPQRIQFVKECKNGCEEELGIYKKDGQTCNVCGGTGVVNIHTSGLDCILFPMNDQTASINLDNIVKYVAVPIDTLKYQDDKVQQLVEMAKRVIYNTDIFSQQQISDTATAKMLEMENLYDTLYTYAVHYAEMYAWILNTVAMITQIDVEVHVTVSKDFHMLTKTELIAMLQAAMNAGANSQVIEYINDEIAYSFSGNTQQYQRYKELKKFMPFGDKTPEQQALIVAQLPADNIYRIRFLFGQEILKQLENENENFYELAPKKKQELFDAKIAELQQQMAAKPQPTLNFNQTE